MVISSWRDIIELKKNLTGNLVDISDHLYELETQCEKLGLSFIDDGYDIIHGHIDRTKKLIVEQVKVIKEYIPGKYFI